MRTRSKNKPLDRVRAPYNFVPLSERVVFPDWADRAQHDHPFEDGISGRFLIEIEARTPIFVRGRKHRFFRTPAGEFAIPGSSIRGMIRTVVEIVTFSKMLRVNDHRYGVRDLNNRELYAGHMAAIVGEELVPLVSAGWLEKHEGGSGAVARIVPCSFAKVEYRELIAWAERLGIRGFDPGRRQSAVKKYKAWGNKDRRVTAKVREIVRANPPGKSPRIGRYGVVTRLGEGPYEGTLVFTGQPTRWSPGQTKRKHHDFFFFDEEPNRAIPVSAETMRDFEFVHRDSAEQHGLTTEPNEEWGFWKRVYDRGGRVPVFFLLDPDASLRAFGLAMMFRLAYRHTTRDAVAGVHPDHLDPERRDLAELIFGTAPLEEGADPSGRHAGLRGRVSFGLARCQSGKEMETPVVEILSAPKASYYPAYLEQDPEKGFGERPKKGSDGRPRYLTYMDDEVRVRGWKRYRQFPHPVKGHKPAKVDLNKVGTRFQPLLAGARFRGPARVHNLRKVELGALLWALDFGGEEGAHHGLGLGKPLGYGSVTIRIVDHDGLRWNRDGSPVDLDEARRAFVEYMEEALGDQRGGWRDSLQIHHLLELAKTVSESKVGDLRYMRIDHPEFGNEFVEAKDAGKVLDPILPTSEWRRRIRGQHGTPRRKPGPKDGNRPLSDDEKDRARLKEAFGAGREYWEVLEEWYREEGPRKEARRVIAREELGKPPKKLKKSYPHLVAWIWESDA